MNIGDGQAVGGLFERLEHAYEDAKLSEAGPNVAATDALAEAYPSDAGAAATSAAPPNLERWEHLERLENPVQRELLKICSDAIDGRFDSEDDLREAVVQAIVVHNFDGPLLDGKRANVLQTLRANLSSDPSFREGVERLLLLAARELA